MSKHFLSLLLTSLAFASMAFSQQHSGSIHTSISQVATASKTRGQCTSNDCAGYGGCAHCVTLRATVPQGAVVVAIRCYTNANYPNDYPHYDLHEIACTKDNSWSVFDEPVVQRFGGTIDEVKTVYHNRSHDRDRDVKMEVDWEEPSNQNAAHPFVSGSWQSRENHGIYNIAVNGDALTCSCATPSICGGPIANGKFTGRSTFEMRWPANTWHATVSASGDKIDWDNNSVWTRP